MAVRPLSCEKDVQTVLLRGRKITIENLYPVMTDEESARERTRIEEGLYDIFEKYAENMK